MPDIENLNASFGRYSADLWLFLMVVRHGQLSSAATEAGLSQPRMSQRMRFLEESLGRALLERGRRGISLTPDGHALHAALSGPLTEAAQAFGRFRDAPTRRGVVILCDLAFASFRMLPIFSSLCEAFPQMGISLMTMQLPDPRNAPDADLYIRMAPHDRATPNQVPLFRERVSIVASPGYLAAHPGLGRPADVPGHTLIELATVGAAPWMTWDSWLRAQGVTPEGAERLSFTSYDHVIRSAEAGLGLALGWHGLIDERIESGALVDAMPDQRDSDLAYVLGQVPGRAGSETRKVFEWLKARFAEG